MKIIKEGKIEERFNTPQERAKHYGFHVVPEGKSTRNNRNNSYDYEFTPYEYADEFEYESAAEEFATNTLPQGSIIKVNKPATPVGFIDEERKHHKYDKKTGEFTA